jgi:4'-phosphopantetheinyl transferase
LGRTRKYSNSMIKAYASIIPGDGEISLFGDIIPYLSEEKRDRIYRFININDSLRTLVGEKLIRLIIAEELGLTVEEILIKNDKFGKPYLSGADDFHFNISHSGDFVVCAVSCQPVGIDIEQIQPIDLNIVNNYFSGQEYEDLMMQNDRNRLDYFYDLWTMKESYLKAVGSGITVPLDSFTVRINGNDSEVTGIPDEFCFKRYRFHENYKLSVCGIEREFAEEICFIRF